ncbi:MAG: hypothetical protein P1U86_18740 [Verrucomicrobiales bacterium]|nr:hypothetical protein [Verrucomicrobiales bacterium]
MAIIQDWKIRSTNARCEISEEPFVDKQQFYTCIFDDPESDGFLRKDYSVDSWNGIKKSIDPAPFSFWKSTYHAPVAAGTEESHVDTSAEGMLRRFIDEDDQKTENARYILALMLERKKEFIQTDAQETEERRLLFYEQAATGDVFIVADPGLKLDEIEAVQREVADLLMAEEKRTTSAAPAEEAAGETTETEDSEKAEDSEVPVEALENLDEPEAGEAEAADEEHEEAAAAPHETVAVSDEDLAEPLGVDPTVGTGEELADDVNEEVENPKDD